MSDRTVIYKLCKRHARCSDPQRLERECADCRRSIFRATMRARGITVKAPTIPTYGGRCIGSLDAWNAGVAGWRHAAACDCLECVSERITSDNLAKRAS